MSKRKYKLKIPCRKYHHCSHKAAQNPQMSGMLGLAFLISWFKNARPQGHVLVHYAPAGTVFLSYQGSNRRELRCSELLFRLGNTQRPYKNTERSYQRKLQSYHDLCRNSKSEGCSSGSHQYHCYGVQDPVGLCGAKRCSFIGYKGVHTERISFK